MRFRGPRLLFDAQGPAPRVEFDHAITLRVRNVVGEHGGAAVRAGGGLEQGAQPAAVEYVVPEDKGAGIGPDEVAANDEGLRQSLRSRLRGVAQAQAQLLAVAQQRLKARQVLRCGDEEDVAEAGQHERRQRVIHHRLVVHRHELLAGAQRERMESRAGAPGEDDALSPSHQRFVAEALAGERRVAPRASTCSCTHG